MGARWTLSEDEKQAYARDGIVVPRYRLSPERLGTMHAALERLLADHAEFAPESLICPHIPNSARHNAQAARAWLEFATDADLLDLVSGVLGPDLVLWGSQVFCKPPFTGRAVPWHQDGRYWPIRPLATCSVWIALDDATPENGCLRYVPGSHRARHVLQHQGLNGRDGVLDQEVPLGEPDLATARDDRLEAGQVSLHDVYLVHGSNANRSPKRRAGFVVRYMPATSLFDRSAGEPGRQSGVSFSFARRPIWLVRGTDRAGNDFGIGHGELYALAGRQGMDA